MDRRHEVHELERLLKEEIKAKVKDAQSIIDIAEKLNTVSFKEAIRYQILCSHIAGNRGFPMDDYMVHVYEDNLNTVRANLLFKGDKYWLKRTVYTYSHDSVKVSIFEQNWFCGYGILNQNGLWVGLLND